MTIEERLKELKKWELEKLARELKVTGWSVLNKQPLIDHIISRCKEQEITEIIDRDFPLVPKSPEKRFPEVKISVLERLKKSRIFWIISIIGAIASIIALIIVLIQPLPIDTDKVAEKIAERIPGISGEQLNRLKEKVRELETALKDEKSGNTQERKEALEALKKGDTTKAKELFKKRIEKDETNLAVNYFNLGNAYYLNLKFEEALEAYNKGIDTKKDYQDAWNNKGAALAALGRCKEAIKAYDKAIEIKPDFHEAWYNKGIDLASLGCCEEAIKAYEKAIEIKPDFHEAWNNKGIALAALGRHEEAIKACGKAIKIKPDLHEAWNNKGIALAALRRHDEAIKAYEKTIEIKPDYYKAWNNKGVALAALGRHKEAIKACGKAIDIKPDHHGALYNLACLYSLKKEKVKALEYFRKAIENGFNDISHIKKDNDLDFIRNEKEFQEIIRKLTSQ